MSKKRTSHEPSEDKETNDGSADSVFQQGDNATKRAKLTTLSDTTLQDLPREVIDGILVKAVAMEVMGMSRKKSLWKAMADPVISRLGTTSAQWSTILTSNFFRNELARTFDAEKTVRLDILKQSQIQDSAYITFALKDELFLLCVPQNDFEINVYDRNNLAVVKDVIPLQGIGQQLTDIAACSVSNCLYMLNNEKRHLSVLRITKTSEHQFHISPLISNLRRKYESLSVAANGNLILSWHKASEKRGVISVFGPDGQLQHETWLSADICRFYYKVIPKSNGNFVLVSSNEHNQTKLTEVDMTGTVLRQYQSPLYGGRNACQADNRGRIVITDRLVNTELLDSELNLLEFTGQQLRNDQVFCCRRMDFNRERNEITFTVGDPAAFETTFFQFREE